MAPYGAYYGYGTATVAPVPAPTEPMVSAATAQLIGYGLLLGGAAVIGKLMIDNFVADVKTAQEKRAFIGPIQQSPAAPPKVKLSDVVKFVVMGVSIYSTLADLPSLVSEWGQVQASVKSLVQ